MMRSQYPSLEVAEWHLDAVQATRGNNTMAVAVLRKNIIAGQAVGKDKGTGLNAPLDERDYGLAWRPAPRAS